MLYNALLLLYLNSIRQYPTNHRCQDCYIHNNGIKHC